ncbi:MAG TPA: hypothetical protein VM580_15890, partial [Labilithrix sp.]|nr:hypothetical protein [Labilithrix sp.]
KSPNEDPLDNGSPPVAEATPPSTRTDTPTSPSPATTGAAAPAPRKVAPPVAYAAPKAPVSPKPSAPAAAAQKKNCDPPYTVEASTGRRKYKLECM